MNDVNNKVCLVAINAKYIHTNLAVRLLKNLDKDDRAVVLEHTINTNINVILDDIMSYHPSCVMFSVYIWNISYTLMLVDSIKKISPETVIVLSGPEVSHNSKELMAENCGIDIINYTKGEINFNSLIDAVDSGDFAHVEGIYYRSDNDIIKNQVKSKFYLNKQVFPYYDLEEVKDKILYFESSRGCPFNCSYCMSGDSKNIDYMDVDKVKEMLEIFVKSNVKQVKFVDRTFNYPINRSIEIFKVIMELKQSYPNSRTSFHCEINPSMVNDDFISMISTFPKGLVQFEIGIQSTNDETLNAISRKANVSNQIENIKRIVELGNILTYVDLIAGLPYETYEIFARSFNEVFATNCDVMHLGFLKVLKGSKMELDAKGFGICYRDFPPYEILKSNSLGYDELSRLKRIEQLVDTYKNSGNFSNVLKYAISKFTSPFDFFESYCEYLETKSYFGRPHKFTYYYDIAYEYISNIIDVDNEYLKALILHDYSLNSKPRIYPNCLGQVLDDNKKAIIRDFYNDEDNVNEYLPEYSNMTPSTISRQCNIEIYKYDLFTGVKLTEPMIVLYKYNGKKLFTIVRY